MNKDVTPETNKKRFVWASLLGGLAILALGFALGFFPAVLGEDGSLARGLDQGWRFAVVFMVSIMVSMVAAVLVYQVLKRTSLHPLGISMATMMVAFGSMFTLSSIISGDGEEPWKVLGRALIQGAIVGAAFYWIQSRKVKPDGDG